MDNQPSRKGIPFKIFLDQSTNLITIFGVFNALYIYSASLNQDSISNLLLPSFFILSLFVWLELILFAIDSNDGTRKYEIFYFLACSVEIGLVWYFVATFSLLLLQITFLSILVLCTFLIMRLLNWILKKPLSKLKEKTAKNVIFIILFISLILSGLFLKLTIPFIKPIVKKIHTEKSNPDTNIKTKNSVD